MGGGSDRNLRPPLLLWQERRQVNLFRHLCVNHPSAGSPIETLLRLSLPINEQVR